MNRFDGVSEWLGMHDECGPIGCDDCVVLPIEVSEDEVRKIRIAAYLLGMSVGEFLFRVMREEVRTT